MFSHFEIEKLQHIVGNPFFKSRRLLLDKRALEPQIIWVPSLRSCHTNRIEEVKISSAEDQSWEKWDITRCFAKSWRLISRSIYVNPHLISSVPEADILHRRLSKQTTICGCLSEKSSSTCVQSISTFVCPMLILAKALGKQDILPSYRTLWQRRRSYTSVKRDSLEYIKLEEQNMHALFGCFWEVAAAWTQRLIIDRDS